MTLPQDLCYFSFPVLLLPVGHVQFEGDFPHVACSNPSELSTIGLHNFQLQQPIQNFFKKSCGALSQYSMKTFFSHIVYTSTF